MLGRLLRALIVTAAATGAAFLVLRRFDAGAPEQPRAPASQEVDADALSDTERAALLKELEDQL